MRMGEKKLYFIWEPFFDKEIKCWGLKIIIKTNKSKEWGSTWIKKIKGNKIMREKTKKKSKTKKNNQKNENQIGYKN